LDMISTEDEKKSDITSTKLNALYKYLKSFQEELKKDSQELKENNLNNYTEIQNLKKKIKPTDYTPLIEVLGEIKEILSKPAVVQKQQDLSGFFKDLGTQLVQFGTSTKNTEEIIRNLKWNSTMGIKDRNGSPVNPAEAGLKLGTYDYVALVQATLTDTYTFKVGGASGQLVATVIITFTDATKSTISNVVKTPII